MALKAKVAKQHSERYEMQEGSKHNPPPWNAILRGEFKGKGAFIDPPLTFEEFRDYLAKCIRETVVTGELLHGKSVKWGDKALEYALQDCGSMFRRAVKKGKKVIFIGNGGSSAIASHMAVDYSKNGGIRSIAFNDSPTLTCLGNDFGYEYVFSKQLEFYAQKGDVVVIISTSGRSPNIREAANKGLEMGLDMITFTGMDPDNPVRKLGGLNFHVYCTDYGLVEITHLALLHSIISVPCKQ